MTAKKKTDKEEKVTAVREEKTAVMQETEQEAIAIAAQEEKATVAQETEQEAMAIAVPEEKPTAALEEKAPTMPEGNTTAAQEAKPIKGKEKRPKKKYGRKQALIYLAVFSIVMALILTYPMAWISQGGMGESRAAIAITAKGIGRGVDPKGNPFEINKIKEERILKEAIKAAGMDGEVSAEDVSRRLSIQPVVSGNLLSRLTTPAEAGSLVVQETMVHPSQFVLSLADEGMPSPRKTTALLNAIMETYEAYLEQEYIGDTTEPSYSQENLMMLDYPEMLEALTLQANGLVRKAEHYAGRMSTFTSQNGLAFGDMVTQCYLLRDVQIGDMKSLVSHYALVKDDEMRSIYERMSLERSAVTLNAEQGVIAGMQEAVKVYDNTTNYIITAGQGLGGVATGDNSAFYGQLTERLIDSKRRAIEIRYGREKTLLMLAKIEGERELTDAEYTQMLQRIDQGVQDVYAQIKELRALMDSMTKEYYESDVKGGINISAAGYQVYSEGSAPVSLIAVFVMAIICIVLYRIALRNRYRLWRLLGKVKIWMQKIEDEQ